jgi:hypothetical protein
VQLRNIVLAGIITPDHDTICTFRRRNELAIAACFLEVLKLAGELKLLKLGTLAIDGTHLRANASKDRNLTYARACQLEERLKADIQELLAKAESADGEGTPSPEPKACQSRSATARSCFNRCKKPKPGWKPVTGSAFKPSRLSIKKKLEDYQKRPGKKGGKPKPPENDPEKRREALKASKEQNQPERPESRLMHKGHGHAPAQSYNAQAVVDADGSQLVLAARVSQSSPDNTQMPANMEAWADSRTVLDPCRSAKPTTLWQTLVTPAKKTSKPLKQNWVKD